MMKKSLLLLTIAAMLLPMSMMAQTLVFDNESGLEYLDDGNGRLYIDVGSSPITTINGTPSNGYFVTDGGLRSNWRNNISDTSLRGQAKWYKEYLDEIKTLDIANNGPATFKGIEYFRNLESLTIPMIANSGTALSLDLSKNTKLSSLTWNVGTFTKKLTYINVSNTQLTTLSLPNGANANLKTIVAENSKLTTLDISSLSVLETLNLANSADLTTLTVKTSGTNTTLSSLNLQNCTKLAETYTSSNPLDLTAYTNLSRFSVLVSGSGLVIGESVLVDENLSATSLNIDITSLAGEHIDLTGYTNLETLTITGTNDGTTTVDASGITTLTKVTATGSGITELNLSGCENLAQNRNELKITDCEKLKVLNLSGCTNLQKNVGPPNHDVAVNDLNLTGCKSLEDLNVKNCIYLKKVTAHECNLSDSKKINLEGCTSLVSFLAHRNYLRDLDFLEPVKSNLEQLQVSGGAPSGETIDEPTNLFKEVDPQKLPLSLTKLYMRCSLIEALDLSTHQNITNLDVRRNRLWALNLDNLTELGDFYVDPQETYAQATVVKSGDVEGIGDEIRLYLPEGSADLRLDQVKDFDGTENNKPKDDINEEGRYILVQTIKKTTPKSDIDLSLSTRWISYTYDTKVPRINPDMHVTIKLDPYILYMNPDTNTPKNIKESEDIKVGYYSGTLFLDYPAVVPEGVKVYICTGLEYKENALNVEQTGTKEAEFQFMLEPIGEPGHIIPAGIAMYVRSDDKAGLYDFKRAGKPNYVGWVGLHGEEKLKTNEDAPRTYTPDELDKIDYTQNKIDEILESSKLGRNLLTGTLVEKTVGKREVLTLGRERNKGTGLIGFWPFSGKTPIGAHRCYITEEDYDYAIQVAPKKPEEAIAGDAKGASFFFFDEKHENDNGGVVTEIQTVEQKPAKNLREGWYTLQGVRLNGRPTQQGIYIHNGKKVKK